MVAIRTKSTVLGLDIGASSVKLVALAHNGSGSELVGIASEKIESGSEAGRQERVVGAVRAAVEASGVEISKRVAVISAVGGSSVSVKHVMFPKMSQSDLAESLKWEAKKHVPFKSSDFVVDFQILGNGSKSDNGATMPVLLAAAEQSAVDEHVALLNAAGIEPEVIDLAPLALMNEADAEGVVNGRAVAVMDIGETKATLSIYKRDGFFFSRNIAIPTASREKGWIDPLLKEVRLSLTFYNNETGKQGIERMMLAGGRAKASGIAKSIQDATGVDTYILDPLSKLKGISIDVKKFEKHGPSFVLAMGLARRR